MRTPPTRFGLTARDSNPKIRERVNYSLMNCIVLWDYTKGKAIYKFNGNAEKTHATLSPDGKYVVSIDENTLGFVWDKISGELLHELDNVWFGKDLGICENGMHCRADNTGLIKPPADYCDKRTSRSYRPVCFQTSAGFAMKFITGNQYLRFTTNVNYAILYDVLNRQPQKYFKLDGHPDIYGYDEAATTDTAPDVGLLVMGTNISEGIRVYQYDRKKQTLKLVWAPDKIQRTLWQKLFW